MEAITKIVESAIRSAFDIDIDPELTRPDEQHGDVATNVALRLAKQVHKAPMEIADRIANTLRESTEMVRSVDVVAPGFINLRFTDAHWQRSLLEIAEKKNSYGKNTRYKDQVVVAEYSDPNPFKELHAGHLYTSLVGDAISRLLEAGGAEVKRVNFGGDVGLHVAKTMWAILKKLRGANPEKLDAINEVERASWLSDRYVEGASAYEDKEDAKEEIGELNKRIYQLHENNDHESAFAHIYWTCRQWSYDGFEALYSRLQMIPFTKYYPESVTTPRGVQAVKDGLKDSVFTHSEGAVVYNGEDEGLHTRVFLTSKGLPTYEAKDLGLALHKWEEFHFDLSIIITANDIVEYMKVVQAVIGKIEPGITSPTKHLTHGLIKLAGGMKMSSRKGNVLKASDVLDAARAAMRAENDEAIAISAVRYAFLKNRIGGDVVYDPAESVALEGNSGPYLQYAHARARSILAKSSENSVDTEVFDFEPDETRLIRKLTEYPDVVLRASDELHPHLICTYLYELAQTFNYFYEHNRVIGDTRQNFRLRLVEAYSQVLKNGLSLLGLNAPEKM